MVADHIRRYVQVNGLAYAASYARSANPNFVQLERAAWIRCVDGGHRALPNWHATAHSHTSSHPIVQSFEPDEDWLWCYVDEVGFDIASMVPSPSHP